LVNYWWVNQNQTYIHEVGDGYLWSPKRNANGARNQFYDNMQLVQPGDIVFSYAGTYIKAIGIAVGPCKSGQKPEFGGVGSNWSIDGWHVPVEFRAANNPIRPKEHMSLIGPLLPAKYSPLQHSGDGLQGVYLAGIPVELGQLLLGLLGANDLTMPVIDLRDLTFVPEDQEIIAAAALAETEKVALYMARRGQGRFRDRVQAIEESCRVTGVSSKGLLIASHIKPWKNSENWERLNGNNGLFLSPHVDKLFDSGLITFTQKGVMEVSPKLDSEVLEKWHIDPNRNYGRFNEDQSYFLEFHQKEKFQAA
jgi:putative restriction endonuclease